MSEHVFDCKCLRCVCERYAVATTLPSAPPDTTVEDLRKTAEELREMVRKLNERLDAMPDAEPEHCDDCEDDECQGCEEGDDDDHYPDPDEEEDQGSVEFEGRTFTATQLLVIVDDLRRSNAELRQQLAASRSAHDFDREKIRNFDKDYREKCNELHALQDPKKRTGREAQLLLQLGQVQAELFDTQAQLREANHQRQVMGQMKPDAIKRMAEHEAALLAYRADVEHLENMLPGASMKLTPGVAARALRELERSNPTYYDELCRDLDINPGKKL
jgi:hypothetical protein